jgi:diguanylate cyclase (GGDEF)-like protein
VNGSLLSMTERVTRLPVTVRVAWVLAALATVSAVDHATGPEFALTFLYSLCVMAAAWFISHRWALIVCGLATAASLEVNLFFERHEGWVVLAANNVLRAISFLIFAYLTTSVRNSVLVLVDSTRVDEMTGVLSRRGFLDELAAARRRAIQRQTPLGVVYLDLDGLKEVNDREGHAAGDELIKQFVQGTVGHLRATDVFGRLGGDEFAIVLERADPLVIDGVVGRIVNDASIPHVSCGVRVFRDGTYPSPHEMLARADRRMYEDKRRRKVSRPAAGRG